MARRDIREKKGLKGDPRNNKFWGRNPEEKNTTTPNRGKRGRRDPKKLQLGKVIALQKTLEGGKKGTSDQVTTIMRGHNS